MESRFEINFDMKNVNTVISYDASRFAEFGITDEEGKLFSLKKFIASKVIKGIDKISDEEIDALVTINSSEEVTKKDFMVDMEVTGYCSVEVEAFDEDDAMKKADDVAYDEYNTLCDLDNYEWSASYAYERE